MTTGIGCDELANKFQNELGQALEADAQASGYHKQSLQTVLDSNQRPVFEVYRYIRN